MWLGEAQLALDNKNRVFVPKRFQEGLDRAQDGTLSAILTRGFEGCLFLFTRDGFHNILERLRTEAFDGEDQRLMQRLFFSSSQPVELDSSGRLLIPEKLRQVAGIQHDVAIIGVLDRLELWPLERWRDIEERNSSRFDQLAPAICGDAPPPPRAAPKAS